MWIKAARDKSLLPLPCARCNLVYISVSNRLGRPTSLRLACPPSLFIERGSYKREDAFKMKVHVSLVLASLIAIVPQSQQAPPYSPADERYKADILEVVGHPDDDIEVAA